VVLLDPSEPQPADVTSRTITDEAFAELATHVEACFDAITINDICSRAEEFGMKRPSSQRYVYVI
jgi:hypothetical protein